MRFDVGSLKKLGGGFAVIFDAGAEWRILWNCIYPTEQEARTLADALNKKESGKLADILAAKEAIAGKVA